MEEVMACPQCGSDDWKSASFVYKSGNFDIDTSTVSAGIGGGLGSGGVAAGAGVSGSSTSGTQQSRLSIEVTPPEEPKNNDGMIYWVAVIFVFIMASGKSNFVAAIILFGAIYFWFSSFRDKAAKHQEQRLDEYKKKLTDWESTRVCQRCGHLYLPDN